MSKNLFEVTNSAKNRKNQQSFNFNNSSNQNKSKRRIESANTNFTANKNHFNQSNSSENSLFGNFPTPKIRKDFKPNWKYSYYLDKNDILTINNINNNPEIKNVLCDYKDIDKRPKPIVYSWTKPRMIKILENNSLIEEEVKSHFWKYSHIFENNEFKPPGKLLKILMGQLSQGYGGYGTGQNLNFMNYNNNNGFLAGDDNNYRYVNRQWRVPGLYKNNRNNYEPIKIKRPKSSYK
jgi:hypothetical protein